MTQAATARESLIEKVSKELDLDPWEVRRKNLIGNEVSDDASDGVLFGLVWDGGVSGSR